MQFDAKSGPEKTSLESVPGPFLLLKVFKKVRHRVVVEWQENTPNEAYDCWKYALAGFRLSKANPSARGKAYEKAQDKPQEEVTPSKKRRTGSFATHW